MLHAAEPLNKFLLSAYFLYFYAGSESPSNVPWAMMNAACALTLSVCLDGWMAGSLDGMGCLGLKLVLGVLWSLWSAPSVWLLALNKISLYIKHRGCID